MKFVLVLFLFSFLEKAKSEYSYKHDCARHENPSISSVKNLLNPKFVSDMDVNLAPCRQKTPPSMDGMKSYLEKWKNTFPNPEQKMEELFGYLTKNHDLSSHNTACSDVVCKTQEIFGEKEGVQLLYMLAKYGFNGSPYPFKEPENQAFWKPEELDNVLMALSDFPDSVLPFVFNRPLIHFKRGYTLARYANISTAGGCIAANSFIQVFSCAHTGSKEYFTTLIIHEVAHVIAEKGELDRSSTWFHFSGWEQTRKYIDGKVQLSYENHKPECIPSAYGGTSPVEDFAESVEAYRYNPEKLKKNCPGKYYYIQDTVFKGTEYIDEAQCKPHHETSSSS